MSDEQQKNIPASIRARLLNRAREGNESFDQLLQYFAIERFLFRLSQSEFSDRLIVKGAIMLRAWGAPMSRPTRDIDFAGNFDNSPKNMENIVRKCLSIDCPEDGLVFDNNIAATRINTSNKYPGIRSIIRGHLDGAMFRLQLDIGVDDSVVPSPEWVDYPIILDLDSPRVLVCKPETALAEKFETIIKKGLANSRLKDYFDIWLLSNLYEYDGPVLASAIQGTFIHRGTTMPNEVPPGLTELFYESSDAQMRWSTFTNYKNMDAPKDLEAVCHRIDSLLMPPVISIAAGESFKQKWIPISGWTKYDF